MKKVVTISVDSKGHIKVKPDPVHVYRKKKDRIHWKQAKHKKFHVDFAKSPFRAKHFGHLRPNSGLAKKSVKKGSKYKYSVTTQGKTKDPSVIIDA